MPITLAKIPAFVELYELTGEILPEEKAAEKLAQLKKEAESNGQVKP